jgi:hypothetical protein
MYVALTFAKKWGLKNLIKQFQPLIKSVTQRYANFVKAMLIKSIRVLKN